MQRIPVQSASLASVGYDPESRTLEIQFTSGKVYQYADVPPPVAEGLLTAPSKGRYFIGRIKDLFVTREI